MTGARNGGGPGDETASNFWTHMIIAFLAEEIIAGLFMFFLLILIAAIVYFVQKNKTKKCDSRESL